MCARRVSITIRYSVDSLLFSGTNTELNYIREYIAAAAVVVVMAHYRDMLS